MSRTIPEIRSRLHELSIEYGIPELAQLAEETKRQYHGRRAPPRARPIDKAIAARVYPCCSLVEIASSVGVQNNLAWT